MWCLALLLGACGPQGSSPFAPTVARAKAQLQDPAEVVSRTCAPAASELCACIVSDTVKTLQAGPREIIKVFERPDAVWADAMLMLDPAARARVENQKAAAESNCRARISPHRRGLALPGEGGRMPRKQTIRSACTASKASADACACYERTLKAALGPELFAIVREDAGAPPVLIDVPVDQRGMVRATIASARGACGL